MPAELNATSAGAKTCEFETAATVIASGAVPGEPAVPKPKSSRSFPAEMTGTTPAAATLFVAAIRTSFSGSACGTAAGEVDDVHAVLDRLLERLGDLRRLGDVAEGRRDVEDAVVADEGLRRDAGEPAGRRVVVARRRAGARVAGGDARDVRAVERRLAVERRASPGASEPGPGNARATMIFPFVNCVWPSGKPVGAVKPAPLRNGFVLSTPSSTTPIFTPSPFAPVAAWKTSAPITVGLRFSARWYVKLGQTRAAKLWRESFGSCFAGIETANPLSTTW